MNRYNVIYYSDELYHHGIKGQRWGRRRWQNEDGTLTEEGKERYGTVENFERAQKRKKIIAGVALTAAVVGGGIYLYNKGKRSSEADTSLTNEGKKAVNKALEKVGDKKPDTAISLEGRKKIDGVFKADNFKKAGVRDDYKLTKGAPIKKPSSVSDNLMPSNDFNNRVLGKKPAKLSNKPAKLGNKPVKLSNKTTSIGDNIQSKSDKVNLVMPNKSASSHKLRDVASDSKTKRMLKGNGNMVSSYAKINSKEFKMQKAWNTGLNSLSKDVQLRGAKRAITANNLSTKPVNFKFKDPNKKTIPDKVSGITKRLLVKRPEKVNRLPVASDSAAKLTEELLKKNGATIASIMKR